MSSRYVRGAWVFTRVEVKTSAGNHTIVDEAVLVVNKSSGAATGVTLPASPRTGRTVIIKDGKGDAATNNITVTPASGNVDGAANYVIAENYGKAVFLYNGTEWNMISTVEVSAAELATLNGVTAGTVTASKAVVVDASKDIASFRDVTTRKLKIGDSANDHTITLESGSDEAANRTLTVPAMGGNDTLALLGQTNAFTGRLSTTDGVASGTARVIGGRAYANVAAADNVTAVASNNVHVDFANTYSIPANTLKANSVTRIRGMVRVTDASGADTLEVKLYIGGTTLITTTAFDPDAAGDFVIFDFELVTRDAPGAAVEHVGMGNWSTSDGGVLTHGRAILAPTNLATNGALVVKASAKWSSNTASTSARLEVLNVDIV